MPATVAATLAAHSKCLVGSIPLQFPNAVEFLVVISRPIRMVQYFGHRDAHRLTRADVEGVNPGVPVQFRGAVFESLKTSKAGQFSSQRFMLPA